MALRVRYGALGSYMHPTKTGACGFHDADPAVPAPVRSGWLRPPVLPAAGVPPRLPVAPLHELLTELGRDRAER